MKTEEVGDLITWRERLAVPLQIVYQPPRAAVESLIDHTRLDLSHQFVVIGFMPVKLGVHFLGTHKLFLRRNLMAVRFHPGRPGTCGEPYAQ